MIKGINMNNEIKEILNDLRKTADNSIFVVCSSQEELDKIPKYTANFLSVNDRQAKVLLDYITNLQEENEDLREENKEAHDFDKTMKDIKEGLIARINRQECEIHNLKEANCKLRKGGETLKDTNKLLLQQKQQLQEDLDMLDKRIDRAIAYIKCGKTFDDIEVARIIDKYENILLEILKGDSSNE